MSAIQVDTARLPLLLHELRLPAIARLWPEFAERADKEGWPAARFLSALAELEIAERGRRRTVRNLAEAHMLPSKTLDNFDFSVVPMLSKARVMAFAAGNTWLDKATNLLLFGPPGTGKSHCASAIGRAIGTSRRWQVPGAPPANNVAGLDARFGTIAGPAIVIDDAGHWPALSRGPR